jgi:hypothetical protein
MLISFKKHTSQTEYTHVYVNYHGYNVPADLPPISYSEHLSEAGEILCASVQVYVTSGPST